MDTARSRSLHIRQSASLPDPGVRAAPLPALTKRTAPRPRETARAGAAAAPEKKNYLSLCRTNAVGLAHSADQRPTYRTRRAEKGPEWARCARSSFLFLCVAAWALAVNLWLDGGCWTGGKRATAWTSRLSGPRTASGGAYPSNPAEASPSAVYTVYFSREVDQEILEACAQIGELRHVYKYTRAVSLEMRNSSRAVGLGVSTVLMEAVTVAHLQVTDRKRAGEGAPSLSAPNATQALAAQQTPWGVAKIGSSGAWEGATGAGVVVAVIDTGVDTAHPDLAGAVQWCKGFCSYNSYSCQDDNGHGTHVAGTIAARDNSVGVVGVAPRASLYVLKACDETGQCASDAIAAALESAVEGPPGGRPAHIINMSFGGSDPLGTAFEAALQKALAAGIVVVASAGNAGSAALMYPAAYSGVTAVGATDAGDARAAFSSYGFGINGVAPGVGIASTYPVSMGGYAVMSGTSMSAPHVTGTSALVAESRSGAAGSVIAAIVDATATRLGGGGGYNLVYGYGRVSACRAVRGDAQVCAAHADRAGMWLAVLCIGLLLACGG